MGKKLVMKMILRPSKVRADHEPLALPPAKRLTQRQSGFPLRGREIFVKVVRRS